MNAPSDPRSTQDWLARRWSELLTRRGPSAVRRVQRGQALARRGAVEEVRVLPGRVTATVTEHRFVPHEVELGWSVAAEDAWRHAIDALAGEVRFTAALLDRSLPRDLGDRLAASGITLVPQPEELEPTCPCDDPAGLCRHVAAALAAFAVLLDRDPTLVLTLRGRDPDRLLRDVRSDDRVSTRVDGTGLDPDRGLETPSGDLDAIELHPRPVEDPAGLFLHLGGPPGVDDPRPFVSIIERAAAGAWRLAAGEGSAAAEEELLLSELRGQRVATAASLADALGRDAGQVRAELDRLFEVGAVMRTGSGDRTRYRASS